MLKVTLEQFEVNLDDYINICQTQTVHIEVDGEIVAKLVGASDAD